jgi:hypothetical protein
LNVYIDSSFLVSLYLIDQHSSEGEQRMKAKPTVGLTPLHIAEWTHAIEQHVFRGKLSASESRSLHDLFSQDMQNGVWIEIAIPETAYQQCIDLGRRFGARFGTRTLDSLHVASALELNAAEFWTFDKRQKALANAAGLQTR